MADQQKTHQELATENAALKERIQELEVREEEHGLAEKALEEQSELLRTISGNMSDLLALTDIQGTILFIGGDHSVLGHPHETILASNVMDLVHPDDRSRVEAAFSAFLTGKGKRTVEYRCRALDESYVWLETVGDAVRHHDGSIKTLIFNSRDITERKRAEEELRQATERIQRHSEIIANVALSSHLAEGELHELALKLTESVSHALDIERVGVWLFNEDKSELVCIDTYEASGKTHNSGAALSKSEFESEFEALISSKYVDAHDALTDPRTAGYVETYLKPNHITSMLDAAIRVEGRNFGTLCLEHVNKPHRWSEDEIAFACQLADQVALAILHREHKQWEQALRESEEKYRTLVETAAESICIVQDGTIRFSNNAFSVLSGYGFDELTAKPFIDFLHPDDCQMVLDRHLQRMAGEDVPSRYSFRFVDAWGTIRWADMNAAFVSWEGKPATLACLTDITESKRVEEALRASENNFRTLVESLQEMVVVGTPEGRVLYINDTLQRKLGYRLEEINVFGLLGLHPQDRRVEAEEIFAAILRDEQDMCPLPMQRKDGALVPVETRVSHGSWDNQDCIVAISKDLTDEQEAQQRFEKLFHNNPALMALSILPERYFVDVNEAFLKTLGYDRLEVIGKTSAELGLFADENEQKAVADRLLTDGRITDIDMHVRAKDGSILSGLFSGEVIASQNKNYFLTVMIDITDRKRAEAERQKLEAQLQQAQRLESIGTLAGGIAHDFNNLLMGIQGNASLVLLDLDPSHPHYERLRHVEESVASGADLTKQLLGFSRGGRYDVKPHSMNEIVKKSSSMFGRTKKEISIHRKYSKDPCIVEADRSQLEQVFMNLFVNAWQAMPGGGDLFIETEAVVIDDARAAVGTIEPGRYVKVNVTDTGVGMDEQTKERIFDPFFTTKNMARGTGLGLASVYGIVKGHGGMISVYSEPGQGTTFTLYLPASGKEPVGEKATAGDVLKGTETILLIDDEPMILDVSRDMLASLGYRVFTAASGQEGLAVYAEKKDEIDLVILDMIMPGISGSTTFDRLREINPAVKVLLASGYSINGKAQDIIDRGCDGFIQKPFQLEQLSQRVREMLEK